MTQLMVAAHECIRFCHVCMHARPLLSLPACCLQVSVLDYQSTQLKLLPILATAYCLHFTKDHLVRV